MYLKRAIASTVWILGVACSGLTASATPNEAERWDKLTGVSNAHFNHDASRVITRLRNDEIAIWEVEQGTRVAGGLGAGLHSKRYELSRDQRFVLVGFKNGARVFDMTTAAPVSPMLDAQMRDQIRVAAVFSPDNNTVVIFEPKQLSVWNVRTGERMIANRLTAEPNDEAPPSAWFTAGGAHCFIMDADGTVTRYETRRWIPDAKPMRHPRFNTAWEFGFDASADGKWLATMDDAGENGPKGQLQVWDAITSKPVGKPFININGYSASFLADPSRIVVQPARGDATVRQLPSLETLYTIKMHDEIDGPRVCVSSDGKWILAWGSDRTLLCLDSLSGKTKGSTPQKATIESLVVAPDSAACFVGYNNSTFLTEGFWDNYILRLNLPELNVAAKIRRVDHLSEHSLSPDGRRLLVREGSSDRERLLIFNASDLSVVEPAYK